MPGRNGKGPMGMGPRSGRGAGNCRGEGFGGIDGTNAETNLGYGAGRGYGFAIGGRGRGGNKRGWRDTVNVTGLPGWLKGKGVATQDQNQALMEEKELLTNQLAALKTELESVKQRLSEMEREPKE